MKVFNSHRNAIFTKLTLKATLRGHATCGIGRIYKIIRNNRNVEAPSGKKYFNHFNTGFLSFFGIIHWTKVKVWVRTLEYSPRPNANSIGSLFILIWGVDTNSKLPITQFELTNNKFDTFQVIRIFPWITR